MNFQTSQTYSRPTDKISVNAFLQRVYVIMAAGLGITGLMAWWFFSLIQNPDGMMPIKPEYVFLVQSPTIWIISLAPLVFVFLISGLINRISYSFATLLFAAYSLLMGLSLSFIFLIYTTESVASTFFITAATFGAMALIGMTTKIDLTRMGSFLMMALIGLIIASLVNLFLQSGMMAMIISGIGVLVFCGLTAYDTQKLMNIGNMIDAESEQGKKAAIMGALTLYLDFINLFLFLLRFLGNRRD
jgi:FtsH-binding integral membrane protein